MTRLKIELFGLDYLGLDTTLCLIDVDISTGIIGLTKYL